MAGNDQDEASTPAPPDAGRPTGAGRMRGWAIAIVAAGAVVVGLSATGALTGDPTGSATPSTILGTSTPSATGSGSSTPDPSGAVATASASATPSTGPTSSPRPRDPADYLLMSRAELMALPTSGPAWDALLAIANEPAARPDLDDQDDRHGVITLAAALVFARTGDEAYGRHARDEIMRAIGTERQGSKNAILALGRQLGAYALAADFVRLDGADDERFRAWLDGIRTRELGGHGRWRALTETHEDSANNWGAFAGASRIAASLYLGDDDDVARAARVMQGFLGDRSAWASFQPVDDSASWACAPVRYTPINPPCVRDGIDVDGAIVRDISRGGDLRWPPGEAGIRYSLEAMQGLVLQAELLYQNGYEDAWHWSDDALKRAARVISASGEAGGGTWNGTEANRHVPWLLNARYGLDLPTRPAGIGRVFGYTDWLYGS